MTIAESMRLYPQPPILIRRCARGGARWRDGRAPGAACWVRRLARQLLSGALFLTVATTGGGGLPPLAGRWATTRCLPAWAAIPTGIPSARGQTCSSACGTCTGAGAARRGGRSRRLAGGPGPRARSRWEAGRRRRAASRPAASMPRHTRLPPAHLHARPPLPSSSQLPLPVEGSRRLPPRALHGCAGRPGSPRRRDTRPHPAAGHRAACCRRRALSLRCAVVRPDPRPGRPAPARPADIACAERFEAPAGFGGAWAGYDPAAQGSSLYPNEVSSDFAFLPFGARWMIGAWGCAPRPCVPPATRASFRPTDRVPFRSTTLARSRAAGGGARKCIGDQFAITEAAVALIMLLRRFRFRLPDPQGVRGGGGGAGLGGAACAWMGAVVSAGIGVGWCRLRRREHCWLPTPRCAALPHPPRWAWPRAPPSTPPTGSRSPWSGGRGSRAAARRPPPSPRWQAEAAGRRAPPTPALRVHC